MHIVRNEILLFGFTTLFLVGCGKEDAASTAAAGGTTTAVTYFTSDTFSVAGTLSGQSTDALLGGTSLAWTIGNNGITVTSGVAYGTVAAGGPGVAVIDASTAGGTTAGADCTVSAKISSLPTTNKFAGIIARYSNTSNYYMLRALDTAGTKTVSAVYRAGGGITSVTGVTFSTTPAANDVLTLKVSGTTLTFTITPATGTAESITVTDASVTSTNAKYGLASNDTTGTSGGLINFSVHSCQ